MSPHVERMRRKAELARQDYRRSTSNRQRKHKVWIMAVALMMRAEKRAEINAVKRSR